MRYLPRYMALSWDDSFFHAMFFPFLGPLKLEALSGCRGNIVLSQ